MSKGDFFKLVVLAWKHAMTVGRIQSGFRKTGIYPMNFEVIDKAKFTPSEVTDNKNHSWQSVVCVCVPLNIVP